MTQENNTNTDILTTLDFNTLSPMQVFHYVRNGAEIDSTNDTGDTPLIMAIRMGLVPLVEAFIDAGADINFKNIEGCTPLMIATRKNRLVSMDKLLQQKEIKINMIDPDGWTALRYGVYTNHLKAVNRLIKAGADVNLANIAHGRSPLYLAIQKADFGMIKALLLAGANMDKKTHNKNTPYSLAVKKEMTDVITLMDNMRQNPEYIKKIKENHVSKSTYKVTSHASKERKNNDTQHIR